MAITFMQRRAAELSDVKFRSHARAPIVKSRIVNAPYRGLCRGAATAPCRRPPAPSTGRSWQPSTGPAAGGRLRRPGGGASLLEAGAGAADTVVQSELERAPIPGRRTARAPSRWTAGHQTYGQWERRWPAQLRHRGPHARGGHRGHRRPPTHRKNLHDLRRTAVVHNLHVIAREPQEQAA